MVEYLKISNLALLKEAQLEFSGGFTVVTGETGAGKSVLLGALSMLAGNRCGIYGSVIACTRYYRRTRFGFG